MKEYVLGFMFSDGTDSENDQVALIRKMKPKWQKGLLNGIGGKIELGEDALSAMVREFHEETGYHHEDWKQFAKMSGLDWSVYCYAAQGPLGKLKTTTDEEIVIESMSMADGSWLDNVDMLIRIAWFQLHTDDDVVISITYK